MNITSASQLFAVAEQKSVAYSRKQQLVSALDTAPRSIMPTLGHDTKPPAASAAPVSTEAESATGAEEPTDDDQIFNAFQTVGMVKRILAQLSSHTADWLDKPLVSEFNAKNADTLSFSAQWSAQSMWLSASQSQQSDTAQWLVNEEWELGYQAVQASFSGQLTLDNGQNISFALDFSMQVSWARYSYSEQRVQDPLLVSLSGKPVQLTDSSSEFDLFNNGNKVKLPQLSAQQYYLAYDRDNNQQISDGSELFGPTSGHGFAELAQFDSNNSGFIDPSDDIWQQLYLWRPEQNLLTMQQAELGAISLGSVVTQMPLFNSQFELAGQLQRSGLAFQRDGTPALVQQIDLVV